MKYSEFKRWLEQNGVDVCKGKKHSKLYYKDKRSVLPRHGSKEIPEGTRKAIINQLGLED